MSNTSPPPAPRHAFETLTPDGVMDALASVGLYGDGRLLALSSYENRVYQVGIEDGKPLVRAYSIASPSWHEELEFYSIKVPDGPLTSRLQNIKVGDQVLIGRKPTGTLVLDGLKPGKRLYMLGTGTGLAPWLSLARESADPDRDSWIIERHETAFSTASASDRTAALALIERQQVAGARAPQ
eukprot:gene4208-5559_t